MSQYQTGQKIVTSLTGSELVAVDTGGAQVAAATTQAIADLASLSSDNETITTVSTVGAGSLTAAAIVGGIIVRAGAQSATPFTDTTGTAAAIISALPSGAPVGTTFNLQVKNTTDAAQTISGGSGVTISGVAVVQKQTVNRYLVKKTSATAVSITFLSSTLIATLPPSQLATSDGSTTTQVGAITGAQVCSMTLTGTANGAVYTPTAAEIYAAAAALGLGVGSNWRFNIANVRSTTGVSTLTATSGVTLSGLATLTGQNSYGTWNVSIDSSTAVTLTRVA